MSRRAKIVVLIAVLSLVAGAAYFFFVRGGGPEGERAAMLGLLPGDPNAVIFVDVEQLRSSPFLEKLFALAPQAAPDTEYVQFVQSTGFHYEKDLRRAAIAILREESRLTYVVIADGRFDRAKIEAYAASAGTKQILNGHSIYTVRASHGRISFFTFLKDDRVALTDDPNYAAILSRQTKGVSPREWSEHFARLAGSPVFALFRQDSVLSALLAQQAPGGFQSPQLATLLAQLEWLSIAAKPDGNFLRVVADAETPSEPVVRQLSDFLNGAVLLAQVGLNDAKARKQIEPQVREAYLEMLQSANIEKMDRGTSKSVRVVFEITPKLLESGHKTAENAAAPTAH